MEELVMINNDPSQLAWLKTLQGLTQGIQCIGGEIPFFFLSGWIIKGIGYYNCMAVALGAMFFRMFLYTVIWNPVWIVLIELLNGLTYALALAVKMSYGKKIAPPDMLNTVIGVIALFDIAGRYPRRFPETLLVAAEQKIGNSSGYNGKRKGGSQTPSKFQEKS